jgi:ribosome recycling factor
MYSFVNFKNKLKETEDWLAKELTQIHAGRATPVVLDGISIDVYGARTPLAHIASITIEDAKTLKVSPWDKSHIKDVERAIGAANLGLSTVPDLTGLRVIFPDLSSDRRVSLAKVARERLEKARIAMRHEREVVWSIIQQQERDGDMAEDEKFKAKEEMEKLVGESGRTLEALIEKKEKEIAG